MKLKDLLSWICIFRSDLGTMLSLIALERERVCTDWKTNVMESQPFACLFCKCYTSSNYKEVLWWTENEDVVLDFLFYFFFFILLSWELAVTESLSLIIVNYWLKRGLKFSVFISISEKPEAKIYLNSLLLYSK